MGHEDWEHANRLRHLKKQVGDIKRSKKKQERPFMKKHMKNKLKSAHREKLEAKHRERDLDESEDDTLPEIGLKSPRSRPKVKSNRPLPKLVTQDESRFGALPHIQLRNTISAGGSDEGNAEDSRSAYTERSHRRKKGNNTPRGRRPKRRAEQLDDIEAGADLLLNRLAH